MYNFPSYENLCDSVVLKFSILSSWFQVMGTPDEVDIAWRLFIQYIVPLNIKLFAKYLRRHPNKHIRTNKPPEKLSSCLHEP